MIQVALAAEAASWAEWLWQHRDRFEPVLRRLGDVGALGRSALVDPYGAVRRIGNTLVFGQGDGGARVIAFIEQTSPKLDTIQQAVNGLQAGQATLGLSLSALTGLSMVTLGLSALTPLVLSYQFRALSNRLATIQKGIAKLSAKFDAAKLAELRTGLALLEQGTNLAEQGNHSGAEQPLAAAVHDCLNSMKYFAELLGQQLQQRKPDLDEVQLLSRHLVVAMVAVASGRVAQGQDSYALSQSHQEKELLQQATRHVFQSTVGRDPTCYLLPPMREYGVTIDFMARLFQQARDAQVCDPGPDGSPAAWFEEHRTELFRARAPRLPWGRRWYISLQHQLQRAVSAVEEVNRIMGLSRLLEELEQRGEKAFAAKARFRPVLDPPTQEAPYTVWAIA